MPLWGTLQLRRISIWDYQPALPRKLRKLATGTTTQNSKKLLDGATLYLKALGLSRIGLTGYCFGGTHAFSYICETKDINAAAIYYASRIPSDEQLAKISAPLLIIFGDQITR